jgi:hypothetical protein
MKIRTISQQEILSLIACADDYGHWNDVCISILVDWAAPITPGDIEEYAVSLESEPQYSKEDGDKVRERLTKVANKYALFNDPDKPEQASDPSINAK